MTTMFLSILCFAFICLSAGLYLVIKESNTWSDWTDLKYVADLDTIYAIQQSRKSDGKIRYRKSRVAKFHTHYDAKIFYNQLTQLD